MLKDPNFQALTSLDSFNTIKCTYTPFAGGTTNARGDDGGTSDPFALFTTAGDVIVRVYGVCTTTLTGASATVSVGVTGNTAGIIALETATDIVATGIYLSATQVTGTVALSSVPGPLILSNALTINEYVATADVTAGNIYYVCLWRPLSYGGLVSPSSNALTVA